MPLGGGPGEGFAPEEPVKRSRRSAGGRLRPAVSSQPLGVGRRAARMASAVNAARSRVLGSGAWVATLPLPEVPKLHLPEDDSRLDRRFLRCRPLRRRCR